MELFIIKRGCCFRYQQLLFLYEKSNKFDSLITIPRIESQY
mgnify:CR=1 FL=1